MNHHQENFFKTGSTQTDDNLLEGYLCLTRELVSYLGVAKKLEVGSNLILPDSSSTTSLIKVSCMPHYLVACLHLHINMFLIDILKSNFFPAIRKYWRIFYTQLHD